jgi:hypothetical protein
MRIAMLVPLASLLMACTATRTVTPREYLDEQTAATITVVKDPWIFTREQDMTRDAEQRAFLHLYAIDVNRMGDHRQYFAVLQSLPSAEAAKAAAAPTIELKAGAAQTTLQPIDANPRELGIAQPVAEAYTMTAAWWYFPVDKQVLATIANTRDLHATIIINDERVPYILWRDGREELSELTAVLP